MYVCEGTVNLPTKISLLMQIYLIALLVLRHIIKNYTPKDKP